MSDRSDTTICNCRQPGLGGDCDGSCQHPPSQATDEDWLDEWQAGYHAARDDAAAYDACPHASGQDRINWQEGWMIGKMERDMEELDGE